MPVFLPMLDIYQRVWVPVSEDESRIDINGGASNLRLRRVLGGYLYDGLLRCCRQTLTRVCP
ncbi:hypothetical protein SCLCIDRAFT_1218171 [Scleroderma citrinum Foug A]|uniref:Uncharacterized protein n=1 Tax=Scleroderma citrinum Foug A TaxID=1036808 RepID=A0A0C3DE42_9AGAM|nr:hypothetical protein SCLCIDRAFT_1218171 [Scleroderma citrinum Foug A]